MDHHKHLGVWLESSLSWDYHIDYICAKGNKVLGLIRRTFGSHNPEGVSTAYKTLVRPILEYAGSGLESLLSEARQKHGVSTEASSVPESFAVQRRNIRRDLGP